MWVDAAPIGLHIGVFTIIVTADRRLKVDTDLLTVVIRESVSLFVLLLVLAGGYKMMTRLITIFDVHLEKIESIALRGVELLEDYTNNSH